MNATMPTLLIVSAVAFAPQSAAQQARQLREPVASSRVPVDVSLQGVGTIPASRSSGVGLRLECLQSIADQADPGGCLMASSLPTFGLLHPYPGLNNVSSGSSSFVGGGESNQATALRSTIGGGYWNAATGQATTVGGGSRNTASGDGATVGGGSSHSVSGNYATVGGGLANGATGTLATVGGGVFNLAITGATVGGGARNSAGNYGAVGGGSFNAAYANWATIPGGHQNVAVGYFSFAAGRQARANHDGAFVWGDSFTNDPNPTLKTSSAVDQFNVYASGGARFFTNSAATTGVLLAPGGGSWSSVSDRDSKENVTPVDAQAVLERLVSMPLATWNYKAQDDSVRHMGPMAQDFHAAFGLGVSDRLIDTIDPDGVALAAIQGLHALVEEKDAEIDELRSRQAAMENQLAALTERLEELTATH